MATVNNTAFSKAISSSSSSNAVEFYELYTGENGCSIRAAIFCPTCEKTAGE